MNKRDYFLAAMRAEEYRRRAWVFSAFAVTNEAPEAWHDDPYPYRIVQTPTGFFFVDPENNKELTLIKDAKAGQPLYSFAEAIELKAGDAPNLKEDTKVSYGNALFNFMVLVYAFGDKMPFVGNIRVDIEKIQDSILPRFRSNPKDPAERTAKFIYVDEYLRFADAAMQLVAFTQLCVPAGTAKSMVAAPGIREFRDMLHAQFKDRLHDPAVIAEIDAKLVEYDADWLKGDDSEGVLISKKSRTIVRKKMYGQIGGEAGLSEGVAMTLIPKSLSEGLDPTYFPAALTASRAGSYYRGAQTMVGGEAVKWLLRASSNMAVVAPDCGSRLGTEHLVTEADAKKYVGFHIIENGASRPLVDEADVKSYMGKNIVLRSMMFCQLEKTDYCEVCAGPRLSQTPTALSAAIAQYGSAFLLIYMSAAHGKALVLQHMDHKVAFQ